MANLDSFLGGYSAGNQMAEQGRQQRNRAAIQSLAPQIIGGDPQAFSKAAALDPQAATGLQQSGEGMIRRARGAAQYLQKALQGGNPMEISAARRTIKPYMDTLRPGQQYPMDMDPAQEAAGIQSFLAETQMYDPMLSKGVPADVQSMRLMSEGLSPEDQLRARRINLGLEGRAASSGFSQVKFTGADGRERIGVLNGKTGQIDLPDGTSFNPQTGQMSTTQQGQGSPPPSVQSGGLDIASDAQQFSALGIPVSSTVRTADRNRQVGGVGNSYHLTGEALDIAPQNPQQKQQARQFWEGRGYQVIDEGDHLHVEPPSRGATISRLGGMGGGAAGTNAFVGRSPEEQAALTEQARTGVQLANLPTELGMRTNAAIQQAAGIEQAKSQVERQQEAIQNLPRVIQESDNTVNLINKALNHPGLPIATGLQGRLDPRNYLPGTNAADFKVLLDQIKGGTFLQAFQSLKGGGAITEVEGRKAEQAIARLDTAQSEPEFRRALMDLANIASTAKQRAIEKARPSANQQRTQAAPQRARNPQTGEVIELRNGQWVPVR